MAAHVVVWCILRFDVRAGNPTAQTDIGSSQETGYIYVDVEFGGIPTVEQVVFQQLIAAPAPGGGVTVVHAIDANETETIV